MELDFNYIRNKIGEHKKEDLLEFCFNLLENKKNEYFAVWYVFVLMKWTFIYGEKSHPSKLLTPEKFNKIYNGISNLNGNHISSFLKDKQTDKAFQIFHNQQFYLQKSVYTAIYATQLKLFSSLKSKHDIEKSFKDMTGFSIFDFLFIEQTVWLYINANKVNDSYGLNFNGFLEEDFFKVLESITGYYNTKCFFELLTLDFKKANESITNFRNRIKKEDWQTMEISFLTMFPFQIFKGKMRLVHESIFNYTANYYIYDFLKVNDTNFTTEFGHRLENYIRLGLAELGIKFLDEIQLKKSLPEKSNLTDFYIQDENIFIECKAIEMQPHTSVNPTDELIYNDFKKTIFKAYFKQLVTVSKAINPSKENWGIIITYKELFFSKFSDLFEIGKSKYGTAENDVEHLPPENVFIIDLYTWDKVVQIVKNGKATFSDILKTAKNNNSRGETSKQLFSMHLDIYGPLTIDLEYLTQEFKTLNFKSASNN